MHNQNKKHRLLVLVPALMLCGALHAQITSVHGTVSDDMGTLIGATVCEIDNTGRIINSTVTDMNGNFTMPVKNPKNKIRFTYVGCKPGCAYRPDDLSDHADLSHTAEGGHCDGTPPHHR